MATNKTIGTLIFRIESDTKALRKGMAQTNRQIKGLKKSFNTIAVAAIAAFSIRAVTGFSKEIVRLAGEMEGVSDAFKRIATVGLLDDLKRSTKETVSNLDLMKRAVMAHNFQIPLEQLASLFAFATKRAQQTGESVDFLVNSIVIGIGRKSPLILDNLGISAVRLREELNNAGHSGATVFQVAQAVGKIAQKEMSTAGDIINTTQVTTARLVATMSDLKVEMGQNLTPAVHKATTALANFLDKVLLDPKQEGINDAAEQLAEFKKELVGLDKEARKSKIIENIVIFRTVLKGFQKDLVDLSGEKLNFWQQLWHPDFDINDWKLQVSVTDELITKYKELIRVYTNLLKTGVSRPPAIPVGPGPEPTARVQGIGMGGGRTFGQPLAGLSLGDPSQRFPDILQFSGVVDNVSTALKKVVHPIRESKKEFVELGLVVQQAFMAAVDAFGSLIESLARGDMENAFNAILGVFGGFIAQMGKMVIAYGIAALAIDLAFDNPFAAIAAGIALVAIGSAISGLASRGPSMSGVSASGGGGFAASQTTTVLRGQDIYLANQRAGISLGNTT